MIASPTRFHRHSIFLTAPHSPHSSAHNSPRSVSLSTGHASQINHEILFYFVNFTIISLRGRERQRVSEPASASCPNRNNPSSTTNIRGYNLLGRKTLNHLNGDHCLSGSAINRNLESEARVQNQNPRMPTQDRGILTTRLNLCPRK